MRPRKLLSQRRGGAIESVEGAVLDRCAAIAGVRRWRVEWGWRLRFWPHAEDDVSLRDRFRVAWDSRRPG